MVFMTDIVPAILPKSFEELASGLAKLRGIAPLVQVDLVGENVLRGREAPPLWEEFDFEFDVMLPDPVKEVPMCVELGASRVVVHADAVNALEAVLALQQYRGGSYPVEAGIGLASTAHPEELKKFEGLYDYVQVMGIARIGKQGEPFDVRAIETVRAVRARYPELFIQVDGAAATHPRELVEAGANRLVVGSAIVNAADPKAALQSLYTEAHGSN